MPVKHDDERRWVELEYLMPGTPEQVWQAIATGPGMTAWFTPTRVDERVGGRIAFDLGGGAASLGTITEWQPPRRLAYEERDWNGEAPPVATEVVVTARNGDTCLIRMVHSLFTTADTWDDELAGFEAGWPGFFAVLRAYLRSFPGQRAGAVRAMTSLPGPLPAAWRRFAGALGVAGADLGERRETPTGAPALAGTVERVRQDDAVCEVMLRIDRPAPGIALLGSHVSGDAARAAVCLFLYGDDAPTIAAQLEPAWRAWFEQQLQLPIE